MRPLEKSPLYEYWRDRLWRDLKKAEERLEDAKEELGSVDEKLKEYVKDLEKEIEFNKSIIERNKRDIELLEYLAEVNEKVAKGQKLTEEEVLKAMEFLCWKSFSGCCSYEKGCPRQDMVAEALGLTRDDQRFIFRIKHRVVMEWLKKRKILG